MGGSGDVTACVVIIGNEVLSGRTQDANLQYLAKGLNAVGIRVAEARVIADREETIVATVNDCRRRFDYVFTTGGIGPTHDDITAAAVARAFGLRLHRHPEAVAWLQKQYAADELNEARLKMADVPEGATLIDNPVSRAAGFRIDNVVVLPGVPRIMQAMFDGMRHTLAGGRPVTSREVHAFATEGSVAAMLSRLQEEHPEVEIGSYPFVRHGRLGTSLVVRSADRGAVDVVADELKRRLEALGVEPIEDAAVGR